MESKRLFFLDNLKAFIVNLMIVFHIALCYMDYAPEWWYVVDKEHTHLFFTGVVVWADMFIMPIMFFISGYFGIMTMKRHGDMKWWKGKLFRITLPWILGVAIFAAPVTYMMFYTRNVPVDYSTFFWTLYLFNPETGGPGVCWSHIQYWYLGILTTLFLVMWLVTKLDKSLTTQLAKADKPGGAMLLLIFVLMLTNITATDIYVGNDDLWTFVSYIWVIQPCRIMLYPLWFFLGVYAWRHRWFAADGYKPAMGWFPAFLISSIIYPMCVLYGWMVFPDPFQFLLLKAFTHTLLLMTAMFGLLAFFQQKLDFTNGFLGEMASHSYTMYWIHMELVFPIVYLLVPLDWSVWLKYPVACALGLLSCYIASRVLIFLPFFAGSKKAKVKA